MVLRRFSSTAAVLIIGLAFGIMRPATARAQSLDYSAASPSAAQIDQYLTRKKSPMAGIGETFVRFGRDYTVDPRLPVAISGGETTFGQHVCAANNSWNWFHNVTCPASPFISYQRGDELVTRYLRLAYINKGYNTIPLISHKYCAVGCDNWIPLITLFFKEIPANPSTSTLPPVSPLFPPPPAAPTPLPPTPVTPTPITAAPTPVTRDRAKSPGAPGDKSSPKPSPASTPEAATPGEPAPSVSDSGKGILGIPVYMVVILGVLALGAWVTSGKRRSGERR
jgi:hypothetical protein